MSFDQEINKTKYNRSKQNHKCMLPANINDNPNAMYFIGSILQEKSGSFPQRAVKSLTL